MGRRPAFTPPRLRGACVILVPFSDYHITPVYLRWLSDEKVNQYSRRLGRPSSSEEEVRNWLAGRGPDEIVYAIETDELGHIGNIKYGPINWSNLAADLSIMIGSVESWGRGYGSESTYLISKHLFLDRGLNRLSAASINPAYIRMVEKLGWRREGVQRQEARVGGKFYDSILLSLLAQDFRTEDRYEPGKDV